MEGAGAPGPESPSFGRTLRSRPFLYLWASQLISQSGDFVFEVALLWLVLQTTGSVLAVGLVVVATLVPTVVLGPFLGVLVDRWHRRAVLLATNVGEGLLVAALSGLVIAHALSLDTLLVLVGVLAAGGQIVRIASGAMIPQSVPLADLGPANGLFSLSGSFNQVIGLSIGGIVVALFGPVLPIEYDALSFFLAAILVALIPRRVGAPDGPSGEEGPGFAEQFREGLAFVRRQRFILEAIVLGIVANFFANALNALWAPYADLVLHGNSATYGFIGAAVALGAIVGALLAGKLDTRRAAGRYLFGSVAALGGAVLALGVTTSVLLALPESFALGVFLALGNVPLIAAIQAKVPMRLMGRVMAVLMALILASAPFGAYFAGSVAEAVGVGTVFRLSAGVILASAAVGALTMRELRDVTY